MAVAELLIEKGADVNYVNSFNRTALFWANKANKPEMAALLESHGATVDGAAAENAASDKSGDEGGGEEKSVAEKASERAASVARLRACNSNMKTIEGACELYMMDNGVPTKLTIEDLVAKGILKQALVCQLNSDGSSYSITFDGNTPVIRCPGHNMTNAEMTRAVANLKDPPPAFQK